jgi:hypothetical protein
MLVREGTVGNEPSHLPGSDLVPCLRCRLGVRASLVPMNPNPSAPIWVHLQAIAPHTAEHITLTRKAEPMKLLFIEALTHASKWVNLMLTTDLPEAEEKHLEAIGNALETYLSYERRHRRNVSQAERKTQTGF